MYLQKLAAALLLTAVIISTGLSAPADHLVLSEVCVTPTSDEFIEIYNPTGSPVSLDNYYLTDDVSNNDNDYVFVVDETAVPHYTDFIVRFPGGSSIGAGENLVIAVNGSDFDSSTGIAPDFEVATDATNGITDMLEPYTECIGSSAGISNSGETIILFYWDGISNLIQDVDICLWGDKAEATDKTGETVNGDTYKDDTPVEDQDVVDTGDHPDGKSFQRVTTMEAENGSDGNGITGHDETSESLSVTWVEEVLSPGEESGTKMNTWGGLKAGFK